MAKRPAKDVNTRASAKPRRRAATRAKPKKRSRVRPRTGTENDGRDKATGRYMRGHRSANRIEVTPGLLEDIRRRYEQTNESLPSICRGAGLSRKVIVRLIEEHRWVRASGPRDLSRAEQLAAEARALAALTLPPRSGGEGRRALSKAKCEPGWGATEAPQAPPTPDPSPPLAEPVIGPAQEGRTRWLAGGGEGPIDIDAQIERILRLVSQEIGVYENLRAVLRNEPEPPREALKTAHNLASLTSTLDDLRRMRAANKEPVHYAHEDDDDLPADIDAFREALARRIEAFMESLADEDFAEDMEDARTGALRS